MKKTLFTAIALVASVAVSGVANADYVGNSSDSGTFDIGSDFISSIIVPVNETITDVTVTVNVEHSWVGDITATLTHVESGFSIDLIPSALSDSSNLGIDAGGDNLSPAAYTWSDAGFETIGTAAAGGTSSFEIAPGTYLASDGTATGAGSFASIFGGDSTFGTWTLTFSDDANGDDGSINGWSINFTSTPAIPEPSSMALLGLFAAATFSRRRR